MPNEETAPPAGPEPGEVVHGRYRLESLIGQVATGRLFDAVDELTEDSVCIEVIHPELVSDKDAVRRFLRAGALMRSLRHPGHLAVYDVNVSPEGHYLATERFEGVTLESWCKSERETEGRIHPGLACAIVSEILDALQAAHEARVVHGGLGADCVILPEDPGGGAVEVRIRDFGLAPALLQPDSGEPEAAQDLLAAAALLSGMLGAADPVPEALTEVLDTAGTGGYPDAAAFRDALESADVPMPARAPEGLEDGWREDCHAYSDGTLDRYRALVAGEGWESVSPHWNASGTLTARHAATGLVFVLVPEGEFEMGAAENHKDERPVHRVEVPAFLLSAITCTQEVWDRTGGEDSRAFEGPNLPINMAGQRHCKAWGENCGLRLPAEAEWEYACRAGTSTAYSFGDDEEALPEYAWFKENSGWEIHEPGLLRPNPWGLYDMHGNVWEWTLDARHENYEDAPADGSAWDPDDEDEVYRVMRGGSFYLDPDQCRSTYRDWKPDLRLLGSLGFRPAADLPGI